MRRLGWPGLVLAVFVVIGLFPGLLAPEPLRTCILSRSLETPTWAHPFGMDLQGCDYLTRTLYGAQTSLLIGGSVTAIAAMIATVLGSLAAWHGGWVDGLVNRVTDIVFSMPALLGALVIFGITEERSVLQVIVVLSLFAWPPMVRLVRGAAMERVTYEHVVAAQALGASSGYILRRHVIPHSVRPMLVFAAPYAATIITAEAILSFVGAGLQLPAVSWGLMLANLGSRNVGQRLAHAPHLILPGIVLSILVYALVQVGARLRETSPAGHAA